MKRFPNRCVHCGHTDHKSTECANRPPGWNTCGVHYHLEPDGHCTCWPIDIDIKRTSAEMSNRTVYVLTLQTWEGYGRAHHWYGRIHWKDATDNFFHSDDSQTEPDEDEITTCRHPSRESCIAGARRWFETHRQPRDVLLIGTWGLDGWQNHLPVEVLEGTL